MGSHQSDGVRVFAGRILSGGRSLPAMAIAIDLESNERFGGAGTPGENTEVAVPGDGMESGRKKIRLPGTAHKGTSTRR